MLWEVLFLLQADKAWLPKITAAWQHGELTNLDYLLYLNLVSRSFHDLTQYPVFPWVLADYSSASLDLDNPKSFRDLSLPMGAISPARLQVYQQRYWDMPREEVRAWCFSPLIFSYKEHNLTVHSCQAACNIGMDCLSALYKHTHNMQTLASPKQAWRSASSQRHNNRHVAWNNTYTVNSCPLESKSLSCAGYGSALHVWDSL